MRVWCVLVPVLFLASFFVCSFRRLYSFAYFWSPKSNEFIKRHIPGFVPLPIAFNGSVQSILVSDARHIYLVSLHRVLHCFVGFLFFFSSSKFEPARPTNETTTTITTKHTNDQPRITAKEKWNETKRNTRIGKQVKIQSHTRAHTMFKNITKSVCIFIFRWRFGHRPLAERYSVSFWLFGRSFVRSCVFFGFCFRLKLFMNDKKWWNFVLGNLKLCSCAWVSVFVYADWLAYCTLLSVMRWAVLWLCGI